jgi:CRP/FNR family transcriptional regulator, cyclic AMP receptor protein
MLAFIDVPAYLQELDERSRRAGVQLAQALGPALQAQAIAAGDDATRAEGPTLLYLESGCLKWQEGARLVRLYNDGDWLPAGPEGAGGGVTATSDFTTHVRAIARTIFDERVRADPALAALWDEHRDLQQRILLGIAGALAREDQAPNTRIVRHRANDVIVTEGSPADAVFVMLEGAASVRVQGNVVGNIGEGEVFGEISFLTGQPRSASVIATVPCLVQVIERDQFAVMVRANPQLMVHVATTLASRVVDLNGKLQTRPPAARG